jgi:hypothetical protein
MAERSLSVDHVTIWRWVQHYAPVLDQRIRREKHDRKRSWRASTKTYIKVAGKWPIGIARSTVVLQIGAAKQWGTKLFFFRPPIYGPAGEAAPECARNLAFATDPAERTGQQPVLRVD